MTSSARVCAVSSNTVPAAYEKSVFINCPFDDDFQPLFHAIVLTVAAQGFTPRCAHETEGQADPRIVRIARGLMESKYSIPVSYTHLDVYKRQVWSTNKTRKSWRTRWRRYWPVVK